jgi:hypothetical protein
LNITLNGLSRSWDAFAASMNTRKEFPTLEELWTCCAQEETRLNSKGKSRKEEDAQDFATKFMSKVQCFECHEYGHYRRDCPKLSKKRKEEHHASISNDKVPSNKSKHEETYFFY